MKDSQHYTTFSQEAHNHPHTSILTKKSALVVMV